MEPTLDQVREELAAIHEEMLVLPSDAFARRAELRSRQNDLRRLSHEMAEGTTLHDPEVLKAAFNRLQTLREHVLSQHVSPQATAVGVGGASTDFYAMVNNAIDAGGGLKDIEAQLEAALSQLRSSRSE